MRSYYLGFTLFSLLLLSVYPPRSASGQDPRPEIPLRENELSDRLSFYRSVSTIDVSFKQTKHMKDIDVELRSEGQLQVIRPSRIIWEITRPSPLQVTLDAHEIRIVSGKGTAAQTQILHPEEAASERSTQALTGLKAWLNLDVHEIARQYEVTSKTRQEYVFKPRQSAEAPFKDVLLTLGTDGHFRKMVLHESSGDWLEIDFGKPRLGRAAQ